MANENPTIAVREGEALDWDYLENYLADHIKGLEGPLEVTQYPSGNSNLTYALHFANKDLVMRRPPFGSKPKSGHSMHREYRVMNSLKPVYPAVPETYHYTDDDSVIGAEFYVMDKVPGQLILDHIPEEWQFGEAETRKLCLAIWDQLIALHQVDYKAAGLEDFGRPEGYVERQITGWNQRFQNSRTPDVDSFEDVQQWLSDKRPSKESAHCIVHGDFRIDNVILDSVDHFKVNAVLDWEISALGDPLMDLGNALAYWVQNDDPEEIQEMVTQPSNAPGMLTRSEILAYYAEQTGANVDDFDFYLIYGYFRNAVIMQQIYHRFYHGQTKDPRFGTFREAVMTLGNHCRHLIQSSHL